jgi:hypothetical protein
VPRTLNAPRRSDFKLAPAIAVALLLAAPVGVLAQTPARGPSTTPLQSTDITLVPHRAVYDLTLRNVRPGSSVTNVAGRMVYELTGNVCDGFTQTSRFVLQTTTQDGSSTLDVRSTTFEDGKAERFRFNTTTVRDGRGNEVASGEAARTPTGIAVELTRPNKQTRSFGNAYYPVQHSFALLKAARAGETRVVGELYDGSDSGGKAYDTTANIGALRPIGTNARMPQIKGGDKLDRLRAWPVAISYFDVQKGQADALPVYEMAFLFYDNGVSRNLVIDYGEYAIAGDATSVEYLDPAPGAAPCDPAKIR